MDEHVDAFRTRALKIEKVTDDGRAVNKALIRPIFAADFHRAGAPTLS